MSDSRKARSDYYGQLITRLDAKRLKRNEPLAQYTTVGGAVWQNLHFLSPAPDRERTMFIAEIFQTAELLTYDGKRKTVDREYMQFGYDTSTLHKQRDIALLVELSLIHI